MPSTRNLNFLPRTDRLHLLQAGTLVALVACGVMTGFVLRGGGQRTATISDATTETPAPIAAPKQTIVPKAISANPATSLNIETTGNMVRYYEQQTGMAFSVNLNTQKTNIISEKRLSDFSRAYWVPNSTQIITELRPPSGVRYQLVDTASGETTSIGSGNIVAVAPSLDGRSLAYIEMVGDTSTLFIGAIDGSSPKKLLETRAQDVHLSWPRADILVFDSKRVDRPGRDLSVVDLGGTLSVLMVNRENLEYQWSPDGSGILFSYFSSEDGISLWYRDVATGTEISLGIATSARKCAWHIDSLSITCGIPSKSALTRDVSADRSATVDDIMTIDLLTGQQEQVYRAGSGVFIGVINPLIAPSETYFVFTNLFDAQLYLLPL